MADPKAAMAAILEKYSPKNSKSGTTSSKAAETESTSKAKKAMDEILEKYSPKPDVLDALPGLRGKETEIFKPSPIYDYTGASRKKSEAKQGSDQKIEYDSGSVLKLGAGPLSNNAVTSGVVSGKLELTSRNKDGKYSVEKNTEYVAPKKKADIIDRSPARMAELEAVKNPSEAQIEELAIIKKELAEKAEAAKLKEERELGDNWFSWLGKSRDSTLPLSTADTQAQKAIGSSVGAAAQNVAGSLMSVIATLNELDARTRARDEADSAKLKAAQSALEKGEEVDLGRSEETWRADMTAKTDEYTEKVKNDLAHEFSGILMNNAEQLRNEAYRAAGDEGKFLVDLLYTGTQMAGDFVANVIVPGSGLWLMSARVFGQSAYEARENGADAATQFVTGLKSAVIEYLTEKLGGGAFKRIYGAGMVDNAIESVLGRLFKTNTGRTVIRYIMTAVNEGNEEVLSDVLNPVADRLLGLDDGEGALFTDEDLGQMWYDWMLGTALGGIGAAVNIAGGSNAEQNAELRLTESAQKALVESGLESDTNTESYKLAEKYKKTLDSGRLLSNKQVKKLTEANDAAIRNEVALQSAIDAVKETVPERAARMFAERGEQASPELISGITNLITDQQVTQEQAAAIVASDNSAEVVQQLAQEYITQEAPEVQESAPVDGPMELWDGNNIVESMFPNEVKNGILNEQDVADIQSYYDESGRAIDLNELEAMVRDYIENKKEAKTNEGRKQSSDGSVGREPDVGAGEQAGRIPKSAGRAEENKRSEQGGEGARREDIPKAHRVSSKEIGLSNGTDKQNLQVVPDKKLHPATQRIIKAFDKAANGITAVKGRLEVKQGIIQGVTTPDGKVVFRTDHAVYGQEEILLHECGHLYIRGDRALKNALNDACLDSMTEKELHQLSIKYGSLWQGLMSEDITDEEFLNSMLEEIYCDALAGIDRINASGAGRLTEAVRSVFAEETGIDVNALLNGTEAVTQTAAKTRESKAAKPEPRNNGPPMDRYSTYWYSADEYDPETASIKEQIEHSREILNNMLPIAKANVPENLDNKTDAYKWAVKEFKKINYAVQRRNIGEIRISRKDINKGLKYAKSQEERAAIILVPKILEDGIEIGSHMNHKGREKRTITFAAPVVMNGIRGNMAVMVNRNSDSYNAHRIVLPDGTAFRFSNKKTDATSGLPQGVAQKSSLAKAADIASEQRITETDDKVKQSFSIDDTAYMEAVGRGDIETAQRMVDEAARAAMPKTKILDEEGKLLTVYHGTSEKFTVFDKAKGRANMDIQGSFFSPWELDAQGYGENVGAYYLNIVHPASESVAYKALNKFKGQNGAGIKAREYLESLGYDGVNNSDEEFIAFNSEQIKSADPVTYDDNGNVIPLSKRFNEGNEDIRYSVDDSLLVEGDPDYADTLSKVREDARRYSAVKLEERISNFDGRIKGYEETENRTERMELELEDLRNRRKVYSDALKRKKAKNDERRQANETAKTEAKATAQRITEVQGRNRSKATLRDTIFRDFNIQEGRNEAADVINAFADKYAEQGRISRKDLNGLFDTLMEKGLFVAEAEDYARELRAHLAGSSVRVPSYVKAEFGDDWINFYRRAWGNKIYLKIDSGSNGIDTWTQELAGSFGEGTFDTSADLKTQLERIVELAEQGRDEKMDLFHMAEYVRKREGRDTADAIVDELYQKLENAVKTYASNAKLEMELTYKNAFQQARDRAIRQENARRAQEKKELRERQQDTLKQLQILKRMRDTTSQEFREQIDRVLDGIDTIAVSAANAMNYSDKYNATWGSIVAMYNEAKANDPNWLPDTYVDKLMERIDGKHLDEMEPADLEQLYQAAVALRTKIYNTRNIIGSETNMMFNEAYDSVRGEMHGASKPKNRYGAKWAAMRNAMNPNHYLERLAGWNPDSVWYKTFAKGLEDGERKMKRYVETSKQMLDEFARTHRKWLEVADGQGKNGIWYEVKVSPVAEWRKGDQPIFGEPITVYMTPLQKVHMYLESKNYDNLAHMLGGRVFADRELYSKGNKAEAFASDPIHLARADVLRISSDLTEEEMELANILERYYNTYAKGEINKVSNELYGFDRAMAGNYAPIFTKDTYNTFTPAIIDGTAEGVGHMKTRIKGARTPTVNISAMDAFNKHVSQTSRFVGMSIPLHNMKGILNWTQNGKKMQSVIEQEWSKADLDYVQKLITELQNPNFTEPGVIESKIDKIQSAYIGSVFGFNPSVALKVFGSWNLASAELGFENVKGAFTKVDPELIRKYTSEYDVRVRGYASPEVARLVNSQGRIEKLIQNNKVTKELFGGGLMIHTDALVARSIWAWSEAAVRNENPDLEVGTQEQIDAGQSPFYKAVAERYNTAIGNTQSMYDIMHRSALLRSDKAIDRAFTMFHTDIMQAANLLIKAKGEHDYYRKALAADPENKALQAKAAKYEHSVGKAAAGVVTSSLLVALVSVLNKLYKRRDEFYDENKEFMWDKFGIDYATYILKDFTGMLPGVDVVAGGLIDYFRGEKWYDVEVMGLSLFNDLVDKGIKVASKIIDGTATLEDYKDLAFLVARRFSLPLDNVERYTLGLFSWVAPEIGEAYNNMISPPDKSDLKGKSGEVLERDIYDMYKQFGLDRETTDELARLYDLGYDKIIYGATPDHITIDGTEYELDNEAAERYSTALSETLSKVGEVISSDEYQEADDKERMGMLKRLNAYATETAKAAAVPEYDMSQWAESCKGLVDSGESIMTVAMMPYTEKTSSSSSEDNDPRYVKFIKAGVEYNNARDIEEKLTALVPENGAKSVTQTQKIAAIAYMPIPEDEKSAAIKLIYGTAGAKSFEKYQTAMSAGLSSADYADFLAALDRINDNSGVSQEEFKQAVRESGMPDDVAAKLWATYGWKKAYSRN